jgi:hypothetical protein
LAVAWSLDAVAQDRDISFESFSPSGDAQAYVADPSESYVIEGSFADEPDSAAPVRAARDAGPSCRAYYPAGAGRDRSGTVCEQTDGSLRVIAAPAFTGAPGAVGVPRSSQYCREYQQTVSAGGRPRIAYGRACWQADGSWQIVTPPAIAAAPPGGWSTRAFSDRSWADAEPYDTPEIEQPTYSADAFAPAYRYPPPRTYAPPTRAPESRLRLPEFYFGNLFWWLPHSNRGNGRGHDRYDD